MANSAAIATLKRTVGFLAAAVVWAWASLASGEDRFPLRQQPIDYFGPSSENPVAQLTEQIEAGTVRLEFEEGSPQGYLRSLLAHLNVPVESQILNFTAAARNAQHVRYEQPRAIYFSDEVTVGYVPGTTELELTAFDPVRGAVFYTLRQLAADKPRITREDDCLQCHVSPATTHGTAGLILSSLVVSTNGKDSKLVPLRTSLPFEERFGAWFVTGETVLAPHRGNDRWGAKTWATTRLAQAERDQPSTLPVELAEGRYPSRESDIAALLVFSHLVEVHNLAARLRYESLLGRPVEATEERLVRELLGADEAPLPGPLGGSERFRTVFERGAETGKDELRRLDLSRRLFAHRLSPLRRSRIVESLPTAILARMDRRIELVLEGRVDQTPFDTWPLAERVATQKAWRRAAAAGRP